MQNTNKRQKPPAAPAFQVYPGDELSDARKTLLTRKGLGCYHTLWLHCWRGNGLPNDVKLLAELCHEPTRSMATIFPKLMGLFLVDPKDPTRLYHVGNAKERQKQAQFKAARQRQQIKGGQATKALWEARKLAGNGKAKSPFKPRLKKASSSSSSSSLSPIPPLGEEREKMGVEEPDMKISLRAELGAIFKRPATREWSAGEKLALEALGDISAEEIKTMKTYYAAKIEEAKDRRRHSLQKLLDHWAGELDGAQVYAKAVEFRKYRL